MGSEMCIRDRLCLQHATPIYGANFKTQVASFWLSISSPYHIRIDILCLQHAAPIYIANFSSQLPSFRLSISSPYYLVITCSVFHTQHIRSDCYVCDARHPTSQFCSTACHLSKGRCLRCPSSLRCPWSLEIPRCFTWRGPWASPPRDKSYCPEAGTSTIQVVSTWQYDHGQAS